MMPTDAIKGLVREIPDFPKKGVLFRDITTLIKDGDAFNSVIEAMAGRYASKKVDVIVSTESRGFIFGAGLAYRLKAGFVPVRKEGKLPHSTFKSSYEKEYGSDALEIHTDAITPGQNVLIVDDLLATGGTIVATKKLVEKLKGNIMGFCFLIELKSLGGRAKLDGYDVFSLLQYE
jgi:adenine phosphoribosyltransferase